MISYLSAQRHAGRYLKIKWLYVAHESEQKERRMCPYNEKETLGTVIWKIHKILQKVQSTQKLFVCSPQSQINLQWTFFSNVKKEKRQLHILWDLQKS